MDEEGSKSKEGKIVSLNPQNGLTEKQELFCQHICDGLNAILNLIGVLDIL